MKIIIIFISFLFAGNILLCNASEIPSDIINSNLSWHKNTLKIYFQDNCKDIKKNFEYWEQKSNNYFSFEYTNNPQNADIEVRITDESYKEYGSLTKYFHNGNNIMKTIIMLPKKDFNEQNINKPLQQFIIKHEIGHSLGIIMHSTNKSDIMFPYKTKKNNDITKNDIKLLKTKAKFKSLKKEENKYDLPYLANVYKKSGRYNEAIKIYDEILEENPNFILAIYSKGYCYFKLNDYKKAQTYIKQAFEEDPNNEIYLNSYIRVLCKTGEKHLAQKELDKFLINNPNLKKNPIIKDCFRLLNN